MKKAQVTIFIIIGIIIVFATALFLFSRNAVHQFTPEEVRPEQRSPIQVYVEQCVHDIGVEAVKDIAMRGGFYTMPDSWYHDPSATISFSAWSPVRIPLWQYVDEIRVPSIEAMEADLGLYMEQNIDRCIDNMEPFQEKYEIRTESPTATAVIGEQDVTFALHYPMWFKAYAITETRHYDSFSATVDGRLKRVWELANDILDAANDRGLFEQFTLDRMVADPAIPFNGMEIQCTKKTWYEPDLKRKIQKTLQILLPGIRMKGTDYPPFLEPMENYREWEGIALENFAYGNIPSGEPPADMYEYGQMFWNVTNEDFTDLTASFMYLPRWGMIFNARPSDGTFMRSAEENLNDKIPMFCMQVYHFTYDVNYPVMVTIFDNQSFNGDGLMFRYALPVNMIANEPKRDAKPIIDSTSVGAQEELCLGESQKSYKFYAEDYFTGEALDEVNISYSCFSYSCHLGNTDVIGGEYRLDSKIPTGCTNGLLVAEVDGYKKTQQGFAGNDITTIRMLPTKKFLVDVKKFEIPEFWGEEEIGPGETAVLQIEHNDSDFVAYMKYPFEPGMDTIELIFGPALYEVTFLLIDDAGPIGGYVGSFETNYSEMRDANNLSIKLAFEEPSPSSADEQLELFDYLYNNETYKTFLRPEFS